MTKYATIIVEAKPAGSDESCWRVDPRMLQCCDSGVIDHCYCIYWPMGDVFALVLECCGWDREHWGWHENSLPDSALQHAPELMHGIRERVEFVAGSCSAEEFAAALGEQHTQHTQQQPPGADIWLELMVMQLYDEPWELFCSYLASLRQHGPAEYRVGQCGAELAEAVQGTYEALSDAYEELDSSGPMLDVGFGGTADELDSLECDVLCNQAEDFDVEEEEEDEQHQQRASDGAKGHRNTSIRRMIGCEQGPALGYASLPAEISGGPTALLAASEGKDWDLPDWDVGQRLCELDHVFIHMTKDSRASIRNRRVQIAMAHTALGLQACLSAHLIELIAEGVADLREEEQLPWDVRVIVAE